MVTLQLYCGFRLTSEQRRFLDHSLPSARFKDAQGGTIPSPSIADLLSLSHCCPATPPDLSGCKKKTNSVFKSTVVTLIPSSPKIFSSELILSQLPVGNYQRVVTEAQPNEEAVVLELAA